MNYLKLLLAAFQLCNWLAKQWERRQLINQAEAEIVRRNTDAAQKELQVAIHARQRVRDILEREPERVRDTDKFERKE